MDVHKALHHQQYPNSRRITLENVPDGIYELVAIPLKIEAADGSPVRALLKPMDK